MAMPSNDEVYSNSMLKYVCPVDFINLYIERTFYLTVLTDRENMLVHTSETI